MKKNLITLFYWGLLMNSVSAGAISNGYRSSSYLSNNFGYYKINGGAEFPFQLGIQGQYHLPSVDHWYLKTGVGFALSIFMESRENLLNQIGFRASQYDRILAQLMAHSVVFDARLGYSSDLYEGPYIEFGYRLMVLGNEIPITRLDIERVFNHSVIFNPTAQQFSSDMLNHGPTVHLGYSFALMDYFFVNMELGVYKPLFGFVEFYLRQSQNRNTQSETINHIIGSHFWIVSLGLWMGFLF